MGVSIENDASLFISQRSKQIERENDSPGGKVDSQSGVKGRIRKQLLSLDGLLNPNTSLARRRERRRDVTDPFVQGTMKDPLTIRRFHANHPGPSSSVRLRENTLWKRTFLNRHLVDVCNTPWSCDCLVYTLPEAFQRLDLSGRTRNVLTACKKGAVCFASLDEQTGAVEDLPCVAV